MYRIVLCFILFVVFNISAIGQVTLKITINNLENNKGHLIFDFRNSDDTTIRNLTENIKDKQCVITINNLDPGKYSFKYFHDENNNKELDTNWIGIPKEGMGFSNNAKINFGPPRFEDTLFEVKNDTTIVCTAYYIKL